MRESIVTKIVEYLLPITRNTLKTRTHSSTTVKLDEIGVTVTTDRVLGLPNQEKITVTHNEYAFTYTRVWPVIKDNRLDLGGAVTITTSGNCVTLKELLVFLTLSR
jgi:hypothetical protein